MPPPARWASLPALQCAWPGRHLAKLPLLFASVPSLRQTTPWPCTSVCADVLQPCAEAASQPAALAVHSQSVLPAGRPAQEGGRVRAAPPAAAAPRPVGRCHARPRAHPAAPPAGASPPAADGQTPLQLAGGPRVVGFLNLSGSLLPPIGTHMRAGSLPARAPHLDAVARQHCAALQP